jgi:hypothetical protein
MGGGERKPAPRLEAFGSGRWIQGFRVIECDYQRALEITFDSPHIYFAHPTHPATVAARRHGLVDAAFEFRTTANGCTLFAPPAASENDPIRAAMSMEFEIPGRIRFAWETPGMPPSYMYWSAQPVSAGRCRMDWLITNFAPGNERLLWTEGGREIIEEDQRILEATQQAYVAETESFECSVEADLPTLALRRILRLAEQGSWPSEGGAIPRRRVISLPSPAGWG